MICPKYNSSILDNSEFCQSCGSKIDDNKQDKVIIIVTD